MKWWNLPLPRATLPVARVAALPGRGVKLLSLLHGFGKVLGVGWFEEPLQQIVHHVPLFILVPLQGALASFEKETSKDPE